MNYRGAFVLNGYLHIIKLFLRLLQNCYKSSSKYLQVYLNIVEIYLKLILGFLKKDLIQFSYSF